MDKLLPCPHCGNADAPSVHTLRIGHRGGHSFGWCDTNYGGCGAQGAVALTEDAAAAAWNRRAANAAPDPALLALAKLSATLLSHGLSRLFATGDLGWGPAIELGVFTADGIYCPGIADAIAALLAPSGAGEVGDA